MSIQVAGVPRESRCQRLLSGRYDKRYVVVDEAAGEVLDDARGYGYEGAQNAHRAYSYKSMPPKKKRQREAVKRQIGRWCAGHEEFMRHVEQATFYALKAGERVVSPAACMGQRSAKMKRLRAAVPAETGSGDAA